MKRYQTNNLPNDRFSVYDTMVGRTVCIPTTKKDGGLICHLLNEFHEEYYPSMTEGATSGQGC